MQDQIFFSDAYHTKSSHEIDITVRNRANLARLMEDRREHQERYGAGYNGHPLYVLQTNVMSFM
jgi:hypothetical protein